jgi:hypothetical protein
MKFHQYDVVRIKRTGTIAIITEVNNSHSFAVYPFSKGLDHSAWYGDEQLELLGNVFEVISKASNHPFGNSTSMIIPR